MTTVALTVVLAAFALVQVNAMRADSELILEVDAMAKHVVVFDGGPMEAKVQEDNGLVDDLKPGGEAESKGVKKGWYIFRINEVYQYTSERLFAIVATGEPYTLTFTDAFDTSSDNCKDIEISGAMWMDSTFRNCIAYKTLDWCTTTGRQTHWFFERMECSAGGADKDFCDFQNFSRSGYNAREACCICGGGLIEIPTTPEPTTKATTPAPEPETEAPTLRSTLGPTVERTLAPSTAPTTAAPVTTTDDELSEKKDPNPPSSGPRWAIVAALSGIGLVLLGGYFLQRRRDPADEEAS